MRNEPMEPTSLPLTVRYVSGGILGAAPGGERGSQVGPRVIGEPLSGH